MKNYSLSQGSLFSQKGDFDHADFEKHCLTPNFIQCIQQGANEAISKLQRVLELRLCTRNKSALLQELLSQEIKAKIDEYMANELIYCYIDPSGNKRNIFKYGHYTFILRKNIDSSNDTEVARRINEQELEHHIITINYMPDTFWTKIASLSFRYIKNNNTLYVYSININNPNMFEILLSKDHVVERTKPVLKMKKQIKKEKQA